MRISPAFTMFVGVAMAATIPTVPQSCAPSGTIMSTPSYGTVGGIFTVCAETVISSTPSKILNTLLDFPSYHLWNSFIFAVDLPQNYTTTYLGLEMTLHSAGLVPGINTTSPEQVRWLQRDEGWAAWGLDIGSLGELVLKAEHASLVVDVGNGMSRYVSWETYYGVGAVAVAVLEGKLQGQFEKQGEDLKRWVEGGGS